MKQKRKMFQYSKQDLISALQDIREKGMSIRDVCRKYQVPKSTILDRVTGRRPDYLSRPGPSPFLTKNGEEQISDWVQQLTKRGFAIKKTMVLKNAAQIATSLDPDLFKDGMPSHQWYNRFMKRNPGIFISIKRTRAVVSEKDIKKWFSDLQVFLENNDLTDMFNDPLRIFVYHESEFYLCPTSKSILGPKGYKNTYTHLKDSETITVLMAFNASGSISSPVAFFPYNETPEVITNNLPNNWTVGNSENGLLTIDSFYKYIVGNFHSWVSKNNIPRPVIIFIDKENPYLSVTLSKWCEKNQIILYSLPPNTNSMMRHADLKVFKLKKSDWKACVDNWKSRPQNVDCSVNETNVCTIFDEMLRTQHFQDDIKSTFKTSGLFPLDPNEVDYSKCPKARLNPKTKLNLFKNQIKSAKKIILAIQDDLSTEGIDPKVVINEINIFEKRVRKSVLQLKNQRDSSCCSESDMETSSDESNTIPAPMMASDTSMMEDLGLDTVYDIPMDLTKVGRLTDNSSTIRNRAHLTFELPAKHEDLLTDRGGYYVKNIHEPKDIIDQLKVAKVLFKEMGVEFILKSFDVFYSVLYREESLPLDLIFQAYEHLHFATSNLYKTLNYLLADKSSLNENEDLKQKYRNVIKMLIYIYLEIVSTIEKKNVNTARNDYEVRKTKKNVVPQFNLNKKGIILNLINLLETDLVIFWDPPIVEQQFINLIAELCYTFLQNPIVQKEKAEIFHLLGVLIKKYNYSSIFVVRIVQLIKEVKNQEHLVHCIADDIKQLIETFNCKGLFSALVRELTEWQIDAEGLQDNQSSRACSQILSALGNAMPQLIFSEIVYLDRYLGHESVSLRIAVLSIMTDLVIFLSHKGHLTKDERQCKGDIYVIFTDHIRDKSPFVRSKVFQFWAILYKEHVVPIDNVFTVMKKIVDVYLFDKAPLVRKAAANCLSTFISYNKYGSELSLSKMRKALETRQEMIKPLSPLIEKAKELKQKEYQEEWDKMLPEFKKTIYEELAKQDPEVNVDKLEIDRTTHACEIIRTCMSHGNFADAFQLWRDVFDDYDNIIDENDDKDKIVNEFLENYFKNIYVQGLQFLQALEDGMLQLDDCTLTLDDVKKYDVLTEQIAYYTEVIRFVELMEKGVVEMVEFLESTTISDMHEAIGFFIAAYRFKFDNAHIGINAMIKMVNVNDAERKEALLEALKTIYLKTDSPSGLSQHCETVVQGLIGLLRTITRATMQSFETMISEWTRTGFFDNRIINHLWNYFTGNIKVSEEEQNASLELLRCAALNRKTIVTNNIKLVVSIALKDPGPDTVNMRLMGTACHFLAVAGNEGVNVTSAAPSFRIAANKPLFQQIFQIMLKYFSKPVPFYYKFMEGAIEFVYKVCARPELHVDPFLKEVSKQLHKLNAKQKGVNRFMYVRLCQILGQVAIQVLDHLDGSVYREMKRRKNIQEERKKKNKKSKKQFTSATDQSRKSCRDSSAKASTSKAADETELYDEDYADEEADYILNILENHVVSEDGILARFANILIEVAQHPREFNDETLEATAVMALMRYMLVSSRFCREEVQLLFTILKKSDFPSVKVTILLQLADLLSRFPNIIEPWMSTIYERLRDPILDIRVAAFLTLTRVILQDTIRPHTYIHLIALTLIDENEDLVKKCHKFFTALAKKERNFIDVIPEMFGHLMDNASVGEISDSDVKYIMKFLFGLIDKTKQMESLVERFCDKFEQTENLHQQRHVAFCLSLIEYNDKALNKLYNHFKQYKRLMHDKEIYASFNNILQVTKKGQVGRRDLKEQVSTFEELIKSVFEMGQAEPSGISQAAPPSAIQGGANKGKGKGRKYTNSD